MKFASAGSRAAGALLVIVTIAGGFATVDATAAAGAGVTDTSASALIETPAPTGPQQVILRKQSAPGEAPTFDVVAFSPSGIMRAAADPLVIGIELDGSSQLMWQPTDPYYKDQWEHATTGMETAWDTTRGDPGVVIAVIDSGVTPGPEFGDRLLPGTSFISQDPHNDILGHGTSVAMVAAAEADNGVGGAGVCSSCTILPVQVAMPDGNVPWSAAAGGIIWAVDQGADIINLSFGGHETNRLLEDAVAYAVASGVVVVAAAGNFGTDVPVYPANIDGVISAGGHDVDFNPYSWSSRGQWVDVAAPGCALGVTGNSPTYVCGTSFASPWTAGIAALLLSDGGQLTPLQVQAAIESATIAVDWVRTGHIDASLLPLPAAAAHLDPLQPRMKAGVIEFSGEYSGDVARVDFLVDGVVSTTDAAPDQGRFKLTWDASAAQPGEYALRVDAVDSLGASVSGETVTLGLYQIVRFDDVVPLSFYETAVEWMSGAGITSGTTPTTYEPDSPVTRAQIATFLWRYAGEPATEATAAFEDTARDSWYSPAVNWMVGASLTTGTTPTTYEPDSPVTRAQIATFLWRYANRPDAVTMTPFTDTATDGWYGTAVDWMVSAGLTTGTTATTFSPDEPVTRAQLAAFLWRYAGRPNP